ncbi:MAG: hypothetical protein A3F83_04490 [Candidatus Glassbacteria bacterium RIFCSPLOWO2_12_FULL_58_11]|uniref:Phosphatidate cytidylyltransferase n=2 Tax=Candidatus Glassiibacteriota TaxID=1817805 RepID=A0A1F5YWZ8_9BACT|nr:MAG: hypothetical protein A2Z86_08885 [Candidatus Glassbacteria bacterium GWA2_58_10]OGG04432.1 MAG: hypothetical protein A3F83_04490 [Candidatus Glassbacteria bacterium RIFCSPLOWO2_12_FULL_58_11]
MNLLLRVLVAAAGVPAIYFLIRLGSWYLLAFVAAQAALAANEFYRLAAKKEIKPLAGLGIPLAAYLPFAAFQAVRYTQDGWLFPAVTLSLVLVTIAVLTVTRKVEGAIARISVTLFGIIYCGALFSCQIPLRMDPFFTAAQGASWLWLAYLATWSVDVGSYACGSLFGRHKLSLLISPGKTYEGVIGGILFVVAVSWAYGSVQAGLFNRLDSVIYGLLIGGAAIAGDLVESLIKRDAGVKDSSGLLPGHGGVLDRFDSLLFTVPATLLFRFFFCQAV